MSLEDNTFWRCLPENANYADVLHGSQGEGPGQVGVALIVTGVHVMRLLHPIVCSFSFHLLLLATVTALHRKVFFLGFFLLTKMKDSTRVGLFLFDSSTIFLLFTCRGFFSSVCHCVCWWVPGLTVAWGASRWICASGTTWPHCSTSRRRPRRT